MIKALIFDFDGLLANSEPIHFKSWKMVLKRHGVDLTLERFVTYVGTSDEKVALEHIEENDLDIDVTSMVKEKKDMFYEIAHEVELMKGVKRTLEKYHNKLTLVLASSSNMNEVTKVLEHHGILRYFKERITGDMVKNKKPDPEIYYKACKNIQTPPHECIAFEDSESGIVAAKEAGLHAVAVPNEFSRNQDFSKADKILNSLEDIDDTLLTKLGA